MKTLSTCFCLAVASLLLTGCQSLLEDSAIHEEAAPVSISVQPAPESPSALDKWLLTRQRLCTMPSDEQRIQLQALATVRGEQSIERVFLASCNPEQTPGLLREALSNLDPQDDWSSGQYALLAMIQDHARSYRILEEKNTQLAKQLETTINGIREIETDMDNLHNNGRAQ